MAEFVVVGFHINEADRVLTELVRLQREYLIDLEDAIVATFGPSPIRSSPTPRLCSC